MVHPIIISSKLEVCKNSAFGLVAQEYANVCLSVVILVKFQVPRVSILFQSLSLPMRVVSNTGYSTRL